MIQIEISKELKESCETLCLGCVQAKVSVKESPEELLQLIDDRQKEICNTLNIENLTQLKPLAASRTAYKKLGKDPHRYRNSAEALLRRILQGKGIYLINNVVDVNNLLSIKAACAAGSYNVEKLKGGVRFTVGREEEYYIGIGKELINLENLPILVDDAGKFGSPTSDSERAMITAETKEILMVFFSFGGGEGLTDYLNEARELLSQYASAREIETALIE